MLIREENLRFHKSTLSRFNSLEFTAWNHECFDEYVMWSYRLNKIKFPPFMKRKTLRNFVGNTFLSGRRVARGEWAVLSICLATINESLRTLRAHFVDAKINKAPKNIFSRQKSQTCPELHPENIASQKMNAIKWQINMRPFPSPQKIAIKNSPKNAYEFLRQLFTSPHCDCC